MQCSDTIVKKHFSLGLLGLGKRVPPLVRARSLFGLPVTVISFVEFSSKNSLADSFPDNLGMYFNVLWGHP